MMGIECFDGVVMKNDGWGRSEFLYNLGGKYETIEFDIGNIDGGEDRTHVLQIYKDEVYSGEIELTHNMETYHYVVNVSGTSQLRFVTKDEVYGFSYAIANVNAFTTAENITNGKIVPEIISGLSVYHTNYDYGENTNPYQTTGKIQVHDINTNTSFNVMGKEYKDGITLSSDGWGMGEALFNFGGQYKSITFDYGHIDGSGERTVILEIHINGLYVQELELTGSMLNRTVTIDLNGVNQLKLTTKSEVYGFGYAIFNIKVEETGRDIPNRFTDVKHGQWYYDSVLNVANLGFMNGTNTARTLFSPSMEFTREQFVQLLFNIEGLKAEDYQGATGFSDARSGQWYSAAVKWAKENGITNGIGDGKFGLGGKVTREQIAVFLMNYAKLKGQNTSVNADISSFNDGASVSSWAVDGVKWAVGCGFLGSTSTSAKVLSPLKVAIRSEIAKITMSYNDMFLA